MIRIRLKMRLKAIFFNLLGYLIDFFLGLSRCLLSIIYDTLYSISRSFYSYSYSHHYAFEDKMRDLRSRTFYFRDEYGRRHKKILPASKSFDPIFYIPPILRHRR